jgi:hypothetical protein
VQRVRDGVVIGVLVALAGALALIWGILFKSEFVHELAVVTDGLANDADRRVDRARGEAPQFSGAASLMRTSSLSAGVWMATWRPKSKG